MAQCSRIVCCQLKRLPDRGCAPPEDSWSWCCLTLVVVPPCSQPHGPRSPLPPLPPLPQPEFEAESVVPLDVMPLNAAGHTFTVRWRGCGRPHHGHGRTGSVRWWCMHLFMPLLAQWVRLGF